MALGGLRRGTNRQDLESALPSSVPSTPQQQQSHQFGHSHAASYSGRSTQQQATGMPLFYSPQIQAQERLPLNVSTSSAPVTSGFMPVSPSLASNQAHLDAIRYSPSAPGHAQPQTNLMSSPRSPMDQTYMMPRQVYSPNISVSPAIPASASRSPMRPQQEHFAYDMTRSHSQSTQYFTPQAPMPPSPGSNMSQSPHWGHPPPASSSSRQQLSAHDPPLRQAVAPKKHAFRRVRDATELHPILNVQPLDRRANPNGGFLSPLKSVTTHLLATYNLVNPAFRYETSHNPRRVLTKPSVKAGNDGYDNEDADYILYVNDWLGSEDGNKYLILDILGQGTFGQVVKCQNMKTQEIVAVKVVKNKPAYFNQSMMEVTILDLLNNTWDPSDEHHLLRLKDQFIHCQHLCLVFELLSSNLYELIKQNSFRGLSTSLVRVFTAQLLDALTVLNEARLIHCDLKPENILLKTLQSPTIKIIDFGSACHEKQTVYTYIQSRFYRSPEVLLGLPYASAIDMWSLGCICVELFLGLPLFPGTSEYNQLSRIVELLGLPPTYMLEVGKQAGNFFEAFYDAYGNKSYRLKTIDQYSKEHNTREQPSKRYFQATTLPDIINSYPMARKDAKPHDIEREMSSRRAFIDFVAGLLNLNPMERWTPQQAKLHPFILGEPLTKPFIPPPSVKGSRSQNSQLQSAASNVASRQSLHQTAPDPKRPYGGLQPAPPASTRTYQDAAAYNRHLSQQQAYTAMNAANAYRASQIPTNPYAEAPPASAQIKNTAYSQYATNLAQAQHARTQLPPSNVQVANPPVAHQQQWPGRNRAPTMTDVVPPQIQRIGLDLASLSGQSMTPVLRRDDQYAAWERRQGGDMHRKPSISQRHHPALDLLTQQAELGYRVGGNPAYGQQPFSIVVDPQTRQPSLNPPAPAHHSTNRYAPHIYDTSNYDNDSLALLYQPLQAAQMPSQMPLNAYGKAPMYSPTSQQNAAQQQQQWPMQQPQQDHSAGWS